ncbi:MAG: hypothetical protein PHY16_02365 [Methylobacter sp.]|nr:hypothetical protein [Methylobacter sp.]
MNTLTIKTLLAGLMLLASACAPYPYYANTGFYGGGYTGGQRSYYGGAPDHYTNNYYSGRNFRPNRHDGYDGNHNANNSPWRPSHQSNAWGNSQGGNRHNGHHWH